jgi:uncharacterized membrane protein YozB (DUF420 family)
MHKKDVNQERGLIDTCYLPRLWTSTTLKIVVTPLGFAALLPMGLLA